MSSLEFEKEIPWQIQRVFFINCVEKQNRGDHGHKLCIQAIVCLTGTVSIDCSDGMEEETYKLSSLSEILIVPPGIWLKIEFQPGSTIAVLASEKYSESDYIRNWEEFQEYRLLS